MTHNDFNWSDESTWKTDFRAEYQKLLDHLHHVTTLYYPDYTLDWFLRTDASQQGVGAILFQVRKEGVEEIAEPLSTVAHKFSPTATKWD